MPQKEKAQVAVNDEGLRKELFLLPMLKPPPRQKRLICAILRPAVVRRRSHAETRAS